MNARVGDESAEEKVICGGFWVKDLDFFRFPFCFGKQSLPGATAFISLSSHASESLLNQMGTLFFHPDSCPYHELILFTLRSAGLSSPSLRVPLQARRYCIYGVNTSQTPQGYLYMSILIIITITNIIIAVGSKEES